MLLYMKALGRLVLKFAISVTMLLASVALSAAAQDAPDRNFLNQNLLNRNLLNKDSMLMADNVRETPAAPTVTIASASVPAAGRENQRRSPLQHDQHGLHGECSKDSRRRTLAHMQSPMLSPRRPSGKLGGA